jgi:DNA-directed RNA polymerase specialized sigma24 family protein
MQKRAAAADEFPSTQWSLVARAGGQQDVARQAVAELCNLYWYPVYSFFRHKAATVDAAEDLTQGFFTHLLDGDLVAAANAKQGRFRAYLSGCCLNYMYDQHRRESAKKRGGAVRRVPIDFAEAEARFRREPKTDGNPEKAFMRTWALTLIEQAVSAVRQAYVAAGKGPLFDRLRPALTGDPDAEGYRAIGAHLGLSENAVKKAAQELRKKYGAELRQCIRQTIAKAEDLNDEIRELFAAVAG